MSTGEKADFVFRGHDAGRKVLALLIPLFAFVLQWYFWETIQPYVWFLFFPAVFFSSWLGGMRTGFASTLFSTLVVWWFFVPPQYSFVMERPGVLIPIVVFAFMGVIFSLTHERLRSVNQQATAALAAVEAARDLLEERVRERTADLSLTLEELRESENKYRRTLDSMLEGCQIIGFDWRYLYLNDTADKHNRRPKKELLGKTVMECWPGFTETKVFALEKSCMEDRLIHRMENEFIFPDGSKGWFRLIIQPVPEGIAIYSDDITERKRVETKFLKLNEELEERVRARTEQLDALNKQLEAFSYSVSHDLKAPLRGIDGYSRMLEEDYQDRLDDEGRKFLRNIRQGTAKMHELIEDLLNYSRMERRSLQCVSLDLSALAQAVLAERAEELQQSGILLRTEIPPLSVRADREGLAIVLRNLLENALKFSADADPPTIEIGAKAQGDTVILYVRDNGIGFDMKFHERIFEIFQRLQRSEDYPGTGIGLALVSKAMQRMGGRAWAESSPGEGATFFLEIPT